MQFYLCFTGQTGPWAENTPVFAPNFGGSQGAPGRAPRGLQEASPLPRFQEDSKRPPRGSQEAPKRPPRGPQEVPKKAPRGPQEAPRRPPLDHHPPINQPSIYHRRHFRTLRPNIPSPHAPMGVMPVYISWLLLFALVFLCCSSAELVLCNRAIKQAQSCSDGATAM